MKDRILITETDYELLRRLVDAQANRNRHDLAHLEELERELDRAEVVREGEIPPDVITMNSEVRLRDLDTGEERLYRLVYPSQTSVRNAVSVLAPIGTALLGYGVGDVIEWRVPRGVRRLQVLDVLYQPEASRAGAA